MILSDLDVHREQTAGMAQYFGTDDAAALANHLSRAVGDIGPCFARNLVPGLDERVSKFAADFANAVCSSLESWRGVRRNL